MENKKLYCPHHNVKLVLREAKHGTNRGTKFWGCPTWGRTACNYTVTYEPLKKIEPSIKEKFLTKIKNKKGRISLIRIIGQILLIPIYILGALAASVAWVFAEKRRRGF